MLTSRQVNPVLGRELRERMRGGRAAFVITAYLGLLTAVFVVVYRAQAEGGTTAVGPLAATEVARLGRGIFEWVLFFMLLLVLFLVPGLTASAIAGERERQTLIPMQLTLLRPRSIVLGKIMASLAFLTLLIVATMPLLAIAYLIGGIAIGQMLGALGIVMVTGLVLACISLACSAFCRRVQGATVTAYGVVLVMVIGSFLVYAVAGLLNKNDLEEPDPPRAILVVNPIALAADLTGSSAGDETFGTSSPLQPVREMLHPEVESSVGRPVFEGDVVAIGPNGVPIDASEPEDLGAAAGEDDDSSFWLQSLAVLGTIAVLCAVAASRRIRLPAEVER